MRPTLLNHHKFRRLCLILGAPKPAVIGYLELLWCSAYESGDPRIGDAIDVELACEWDGAAGELTAALEKCGGPARSGFIDVDDDGIYSVHDLFDHAPEYVQKRARREADRRKKGKTISDLRREAAEKRWEKENSCDMQMEDTCMQTESFAMQTDANGCKRHAKVCTPTHTPTPAPTPTPALTFSEENRYSSTHVAPEKRQRALARSSYTVEFETFRNSYPKHRIGGKIQDWKSWKVAKAAGMTADKANKHLGMWLSSPKWKNSGGKYIVALSKWLRDGFWDTIPPDYEPDNGRDRAPAHIEQHRKNQLFLAEEWRKAKAEEAAEDAKKKHDY